MSEQFRLEDRYVVLKIKDIEKYLHDRDLKELNLISTLISTGREADGKQALEAIVVEKDWPEYGIVYSMLERRVNTELLSPGNTFSFKSKDSIDRDQVYTATVHKDNNISFSWVTKYGNTHSAYCSTSQMAKDLMSGYFYIVDDKNS